MCKNCKSIRTLRDPVMGIGEIADLFGVSRQRVNQLDRDHPDFPEPLTRLRSGPVFCAVDIHEFLHAWDRRPGRPPIHREVIKGDEE
jgi:hypothetical protein